MNHDFTRPEKEFRAGAVRVAVWANPRYGADGKTWTSHKVAIERGYKDQQGNWRNTDTTLDINEIPMAILALKRAFEYLTMNKPADIDQESSQPPPPVAAHVP